MSPKTQQVPFRADPQFLAKIDAWRRAQDDIPTRAEAIRRLVAAGLEADNSRAEEYAPPT